MANVRTPTPASPRKPVPPPPAAKPSRKGKSPVEKARGRAETLVERAKALRERVAGWPGDAAKHLELALSNLGAAVDGLRALPADFKPARAGGASLAVGGFARISEKHAAKLAPLLGGEVSGLKVEAIADGQVRVVTPKGVSTVLAKGKLRAEEPPKAAA